MEKSAAYEPQPLLRGRPEHVQQLAILVDPPHRADLVSDLATEQFPHHIELAGVAGRGDQKIGRQIVPSLSATP